ncbi:MAG: WD40 repeat domain-containing protein [Rhabdochlamydiaceae bacterium]
MKTFHLLLIIGIGITVSVVFGMYVVSLPPTPKITINPDTENQLEPIQYNQDTNNSDAIRQVWDYPVDGEVQSVAASYNASYVAAATRLQEGHADDDAHQGSVYLFDKNGNKLWQYESNRKIDSVLISGNGQYVIATGYQIAKGAAGTYENPAIYFFDKNGTMLWKKEMSGDGTIWRANISYNGSVVSTVSQDKALYLNKSGNLIWSISSKDLENSTARTNEQLFGVTMTPDGSMLAVRTSGDVFFVNSQGKILWKFPTQYEDGGWALISKNGKYVFTSSAANSEEGNAYLIDASNGSLLWKRQVGGPTLYAGMSDDGSYVALSTNWQVFIFDLAGNLLGQDNIPSLITMSSDGSFVGGIGWTPSEANMMLMDRSGKILSSYPLNAREVRSISLSGDSRYLAAGIGYRAQDSNKVGLYQLPVIAVAENTGTIPNNTESANSNSTHMSITFPNTKSEFYVTISQGDTVQIPWNLEIDRNYVPFNMELDINSSKMISSWIRPNLPFETVNGIPPDANKTITVSLSPDVTPGNYTLTVTGHGDTINNSTGWMTPLEGHLFATVHVTVPQEKTIYQSK